MKPQETFNTELNKTLFNLVKESQLSDIIKTRICRVFGEEKYKTLTLLDLAQIFLAKEHQVKSRKLGIKARNKIWEYFFSIGFYLDEFVKVYLPQSFINPSIIDYPHIFYPYRIKSQ
jgi:hypothetical protein